MTRLVLMAVIVSSVGCGSRQAEFAGQVVYRGQPVYRGSITVVGSDKMPYVAAIGEDGSFRFAKVPTGPVKIGVLCPEPVAHDSARHPELGKKLAESGVAPTSAEARRRWFKIPEKYANPESSDLTIEIVAPSTHHRVELPEK